MSLTKYNTTDYRPLSFNSFVNRFFNDAFVDSATAASFVPQVDIAENEKSFEIHVAVPGMKKENFNLDINDNRLTISGERKFENEKKEKNFHSVETYFGSFKRSFQLPDGINEENIEARYQDGILYVVIPKDEKKLLKKTIEVR